MSVILRMLVCGAMVAGSMPIAAGAGAQEKSESIGLADGKLVLKAPEKWVRKDPKVRIIEHEFAVEGKKGQDAGRVTVMGAGGSIEQNIDRWIAQFKQPDGKDSKDKTKVEKKKIAGLEVHLVDVAGTYRDTPAGPFAGGKAIDRENYRMLAAIIPGGRDVGNYFIKFYGPAEIVKENEKAFYKMIESLEKK
jgi:hypothetical protein